MKKMIGIENSNKYTIYPYLLCVLCTDSGKNWGNMNKNLLQPLTAANCSLRGLPSH